MALYLLANNTAFDTYENYDRFAEENRNFLNSSGLFDNLIDVLTIIEKLRRVLDVYFLLKSTGTNT